MHFFIDQSMKAAVF